MQVKTLDLPYIIRELGNILCDPSQIEGQCRCGEWVKQDADRCPLGHLIAWTGSPTWRDIYLRRAEEFDTEYLFRAAGVSGFSNGIQYHRWQAVLSSLDSRTIRDKINWCKNELRSKGSRRSGVLPYAVNVLFALSEDPPDEDERPNVWTG